MWARVIESGSIWSIPVSRILKDVKFQTKDCEVDGIMLVEGWYRRLSGDCRRLSGRSKQSHRAALWGVSVVKNCRRLLSLSFSMISMCFTWWSLLLLHLYQFTPAIRSGSFLSNPLLLHPVLIVPVLFVLQQPAKELQLEIRGRRQIYNTNQFDSKLLRSESVRCNVFGGMSAYWWSQCKSMNGDVTKDQCLPIVKVKERTKLSLSLCTCDLSVKFFVVFDQDNLICMGSPLTVNSHPRFVPCLLLCKDAHRTSSEIKWALAIKNVCKQYEQNLWSRKFKSETGEMPRSV